MAKIGTYPNAADLTGTEEFIGVQSAASVNVTPEQLKQFINNPVYKNTAFTAKNGDAVFADSTGGPITITLPATPSVNNAVSVKDCGGAASTQFITVGRNGQTIGGVTEDFVINQNFAQALFIYDGSDWKFSLVSNPTLINAFTVFVVYKTSAYTAESGERVMCGTDVGAFTVTLPASPSAGYSVGVWDAGNNALTNNITIERNGETIDGLAANDTLDVNGGHFEYIYDGITWKRAFWAPGGLQLSDVVGVETMYLKPSECINSASATDGTVNGIIDAIIMADSGSIYAQTHFCKSMPKKWDGGQMRWRMKWAPSSTNTGDTQCYMIAYFIAEGDNVVVGGTANMPIVDTPNGSTNDLHVSPWSAWETIDGTGTSDKLMIGRIQRQGPTDAFTGSVMWMVIEIQYTTNAATDD